MHILAIYTPLMTFLVKFIQIDPSGIIFSIFFCEKFFEHFPTILTYDVIFTPKNEGIWDMTFSPKMTYFDQIDPVNDTFD